MPKVTAVTPFSLKTIQKPSQVEIIMSLDIPQVSTRDFPKTKVTLEKLLPTIYTHKCLNGEELPFSKEVLETEIGHLFEHIIMEYLHNLKSQRGDRNTKVKGETVWDWHQENRGVFHIYLDSPKEDTAILSRAISQATTLMTGILIPDQEATEQVLLGEKLLLPKGQ